ncbi:uncharacterized protein CELE_Y116A8C.469 [Caenorhabditis elegans]|uniref:Uncharacterized protein n=1 Tax=Caenorhabditis elegans TaxID=6239 RepID=U4PCH0_CAEEL|nr:Uncharacterized protein CELE_Y116A8C.469 [Caenorhabditis elegans]CDH93429.2 Uncharacterized protein CELE_Y116A8C.469 [Caenorhabditis elegans]|eukprot:NP_001294622.2 Uncharacterized protein CELE_Y116A8C.469 [Caenorhabditis elegans]
MMKLLLDAPGHHDAHMKHLLLLGLIQSSNNQPLLENIKSD